MFVTSIILLIKKKKKKKKSNGYTLTVLRWLSQGQDVYFFLKETNGSGGINFVGFSSVGVITLFRFKIVLVADLIRLVYC